MSSPLGIDFPLPLLLLYNSSRQYHDLTGHEKQVALFEAAHIRYLSPVPVNFLASSDLYPSYPPPPIHFSSADHQQMLSNHDEFVTATHLSVAEFTLFHTHVHTSLLTSRSHSNSTSPHLHPMPTKLTTSDQLLLWLIYLQGSPISGQTAHFNHLHRTTLHRIIDHVTFCVNAVLDDMISWPSSEQRLALHGMMSVCNTAVAVLDGTHCPIQAPSNYTYSYFSGYKHEHTQNFIVYVSYTGMVLHIDRPYEGVHNDRHCYKKSHFHNNKADYLTDDEYVLADGGFIGGDNLLVPIHSTVINQLTNDATKRTMTAYNSEITANRLIVEDVFGWLKQRACILNTAWPNDLDRQTNVFKAACRLHNFVRMFRMEYAMQHCATQPNHSQ